MRTMRARACVCVCVRVCVLWFGSLERMLGVWVAGWGQVHKHARLMHACAHACIPANMRTRASMQHAYAHIQPRCNLSLLHALSSDAHAHSCACTNMHMHVKATNQASASGAHVLLMLLLVSAFPMQTQRTFLNLLPQLLLLLQFVEELLSMAAHLDCSLGPDVLCRLSRNNVSMWSSQLSERNSVSMWIMCSSSSLQSTLHGCDKGSRA